MLSCRSQIKHTLSNCLYSSLLNVRLEQRWPSGKALDLRSKKTGVRFPASPLEFSEIGYLLLPSRDMAERSLKSTLIIKTTNQPTECTSMFKFICESLSTMRVKISFVRGLEHAVYETASVRAKYDNQIRNFCSSFICKDTSYNMVLSSCNDLVCKVSLKQPKTLNYYFMQNIFDSLIMGHQYLKYCEWLNFCGVPVSVVSVQSTIFQYRWNSGCLYELWRKILWPRILKPHECIIFSSIHKKSVPTKIKPSIVYGLLAWQHTSRFHSLQQSQDWNRIMIFFIKPDLHVVQGILYRRFVSWSISHTST